MTSIFCAVLFCTNIQLTDCKAPLLRNFQPQELADIMVNAAEKEHMVVYHSCGKREVVEKELEEIMHRKPK